MTTIKCNLTEPIWTPPNWWCTPEQQLERARQLWLDIVLPEPPKEFVARTKTEVLLLHVPRPFDELWRLIQAPTGYTKFRKNYVRSDKRHLRLAKNVVSRTEPVWLGFDPEANKGKRPDWLWGQSDLASYEVLSALIQFPDWPLGWFKGASAPNLNGFQIKYRRKWTVVPGVRRWGSLRQLGLDAYWAGQDNPNWASPSVREC